MPPRVMMYGRWVPLGVVVDLLNHPGHADQSSHGRKKKTAPPTGDPSGGGVEALPRMQRKPTLRQAALGTNPDYGSTGSMDSPVYRDAAKAGKNWDPSMGPPPMGAFEENCTNVVMGFEMRMRGFDVKAAPLHVLDKYGYAAGRAYQETDDQLASSFRNPDGSPHGRSFSGQKWRSFDEIDAEVADWGDGGRGYMTVGKHVFNVVNQGGKAKYVEGQFDASPSRIVTAAYRKKYRASKVFSGREEAKVVRLDDLEPADGILESVVAT